VWVGVKCGGFGYYLFLADWVLILGDLFFWNFILKVIFITERLDIFICM